MKRVLVIGDVIADVYRDCWLKKMCPDAPSVPAIVQNSYDLRPGGAANVAVNLATLAPGAEISLIGEVSVELARAIKYASKNRVCMDYVDFSDDPLTKERILLDGVMQLRVDNRLLAGSYIADAVLTKLKEYLAENDPDLVVLSDYGAGTVSVDALEILLGMRERLLVDTKMTDLSIFGRDGRKTRLVKLNQDEWRDVIRNGEAAPERFFSAMVVTNGRSGADLAIRREDGPRSVTHILKVPGYDVKTVDVCGCGDTFLAGLAASLLRNDDDFTAVQFANAAAATVVSRPRTAVADLELTLKMLGMGEQE